MINSSGSPVPFISWQRGGDTGTQTERGTPSPSLSDRSLTPSWLERNPREIEIAGNCCQIKGSTLWGGEALSWGLLDPLLGQAAYQHMGWVWEGGGDWRSSYQPPVKIMVTGRSASLCSSTTHVCKKHLYFKHKVKKVIYCVPCRV